MVVSFDDLAIKYQNYTDIKNKIRREVRAGRLIQITRGLYETDENVDGKYLAGYILGPSSLSFDYALYVFSLIPEAVYKTYTSATFNKKKAKKYQNQFGLCTYNDIPVAAYPLGVLLCEENGYSYQIATAEKALCDKLYTLPPVRNLKEFRFLLFDDLRIDEAEFKKLDLSAIETLAPLYHSNNLKFLVKFVRRMK